MPYRFAVTSLLYLSILLPSVSMADFRNELSFSASSLTRPDPDATVRFSQLNLNFSHYFRRAFPQKYPSEEIAFIARIPVLTTSVGIFDVRLGDATGSNEVYSAKYTYRERKSPFTISIKYTGAHAYLDQIDSELRIKNYELTTGVYFGENTHLNLGYSSINQSLSKDSNIRSADSFVSLKHIFQFSGNSSINIEATYFDNKVTVQNTDFIGIYEETPGVFVFAQFLFSPPKYTDEAESKYEIKLDYYITPDFGIGIRHKKVIDDDEVVLESSYDGAGTVTLSPTQFKSSSTTDNAILIRSKLNATTTINLEYEISESLGSDQEDTFWRVGFVKRF